MVAKSETIFNILSEELLEKTKTGTVDKWEPR